MGEIERSLEGESNINISLDKLARGFAVEMVPGARHERNSLLISFKFQIAA